MFRREVTRAERYHPRSLIQHLYSCYPDCFDASCQVVVKLLVILEGYSMIRQIESENLRI